MPRRPRFIFGDGSAPTQRLLPCQCPSCQQDLVITCPNGCANAHEGATALRHAAQRTQRPHGNDPRGSIGRERKNGATTDAVEQLVRTMGPMKPAEAAARLGLPIGRVSQTFLRLERHRVFVRELAPGRKHGAAFRHRQSPPVTEAAL